ncbi:MAG: VWA domain-containing protein, partial [Deltaproteobacteria bacterium]|nr:VWA domain-containing protein [Deltaproteobacteria bacterium]
MSDHRKKDAIEAAGVPADDAACAHDAGYELASRFGAALAPVAERFGEKRLDAILTMITRIAENDRRAAFTLLEECPDIIGKLLVAGDEAVLNVFAIADQMVPYGAGLTVRFLEVSPALLAENDFETLTQTAALGCSVAQVNVRTAMSVVGESPAIIHRAGFEGLRKVAAFAAAIAHFSWAHSIKVIDESLFRIGRMMDAGADSPSCLALYSLASVMARDDWNIAMDLIEKIPGILDQPAIRTRAGLLAILLDRAYQASSFAARMAYTLLETAPALVDLLGPDGAQEVWQCAFAMAEDNPGNAAAMLLASPDTAERLHLRLGARRTENIYRLGQKLSRVSSQVALRFITASVELAQRQDDEGLSQITDLSGKMASVSRHAAVTFLDIAPAILEKTGMEGLLKIGALGIGMASRSWETADRLLLKSPDLIDRIGIDGLEMIGDFASVLAQESWSVAVGLLDKCPSIIDGLLKLGDPSLIARVCHLGGRIVKYNARMALSLLNQSPEIIRLIGYEGLEKIEDMAHRIGAESWTTAVSLLETSPAIIERVGYAGLEQIASLASLVSRQNSYGAVSLLEKSPDLIDRLLPHGGAALALRVYAFAGDAASSDWMLASTLLEKSPVLLARIGADGLSKLSALMNKNTYNSGKIANRLLDVSPAVIDKMGFEGLEILINCASTIAEKDWRAAIAVVEKSPRLIDRLSHAGDKAIAPGVYKITALMARTSTAIAVKLLEKSPEFINWVGLEGFGMIASFVENTAKEDEEKALSFLTGNSPAFSDFMEGIPKGLELKTVKHVLSTYLRALLGRRVEIAEAETVYTDGRKIYLPKRIKDFQDREDNFRLYKVSATHQEAHLEYGSYEFDIDKMNETIRIIAARYGEKEVTEDESDIDRFFLLFPEPDLAHDLFNLLEDFRIECILKREYPALGEDIAAMHRHMTLKRRAPGKMTNPKQRTAEMIAQSLMAEKTFSDAADPAIPILRKTLDLSHVLQGREADVHTAARLAADVYRMMDEAFKEPYRAIKPTSKPLDQDMVSQNIGSFGKTSQQIQNRLSGRQSSQQQRPAGSQVEAESNPEGDAAPSQTRPTSDHVSERQHRTGRDQQSFRGSPGDGKPEAGSEESSGDEAGDTDHSMKYDSPEKIERLLRAVYQEKGITPREIERRVDALHPNDIFLFMRSLEASLDKKTELQSERGTSLYNEWGEDVNDYRANWTRIREQTHAGNSLDFYRDAAERYAGLLKKIRREFQMLKPEGFAKLKRQYDGDDIDLDAVVEFLVDQKAGISPSEKNYTLIQKRKRDIAVAFLVDMSRSTKGATIEREKESLMIMSEALHEVGDAFAIYGFSGDNRDNVDFYRIKDFDDSYDEKTKKRISAIEDRFENRDGTAIRHTISKLRRRPERTKLMILLSDGKPVDKEYSGTYAI